MTDLHTETRELLPWYANSSLSEADRLRVETHLQGCAECARELSFLSGLQAAMHTEEALLVSPERSLAAVTERIDAVEAARQGRLDWGDVVRIVRAKLAVGRAFRLDAALAAVAVLLIIGTAWLGSRPSEPEFRTLSSADTPASSSDLAIRLVFERTATVEELQALLTGLEVVLISGPSAYGVYTARIDPAAQSARPADVLAELRRHPLVSFAEPIPAPAAGRSSP